MERAGAEGDQWTEMFLAGDVESAVVHSTGFKERFGALASHPYDLENPDRTTWWLFRKTSVSWGNWPAYSLGKYFFDRPRGRGVIRAGLHIEKGISPENAKGYGGGKGRFFGMTAEWAWFGFLKDMTSGKISSALLEVATRSGSVVEVTLEPSFPLDEPRVHETFGYHRFTTKDGIQLMLEEERPARNKLIGIGETSSVKELGRRLERATGEEPWTWINVMIGVAVRYGGTRAGGRQAPWDGGDFWHRVLEPLAPWIS